MQYFSTEPAGSVVIDTGNHFLYLVFENRTALRYGVGVGQDGYRWYGRARIDHKVLWPRWDPPPGLRQRHPDLPVSMAPGPDNPLSPFVREDTVQLNARYEDSAGTPYPRVAGGRSGSGRVMGSVFFDENGDGQRQANERGVAGVQVILDERMSAVTDGEGRYQFSLVPAGSHRIRILVERVPLPWGLDDDSPRELRLDVRGDARMEFGLKRIGP